MTIMATSVLFLLLALQAAPASAAGGISRSYGFLLAEESGRRRINKTMRRSLQGEDNFANTTTPVQLCDLYGDIGRREFRCTLEQYCDVVRANAKNSSFFYGDVDVTCTGSLTGKYSIMSQGYVCFEPGANIYIQGVPFRVCYNYVFQNEFIEYGILPLWGRVDFVDGFSFAYDETTVVCTDNTANLCSCALALEGRDCRACTLCDNGRINDDNYYSWAVDCTNLAPGLFRTCDETGDGAFYQKVEAGLPFAAVDADRSTTNGDGTGDGLSATALGGIIGAVVAISLSGLFALALYWFLYRPKQNNNSGNNNSNKNPNNVTTARDDDDDEDDNDDDNGPPPSSRRNQQQRDPPVSVLPPMAQVLLVDHGTMGHDPTDDSAPMFKDQMRPPYAREL